MTKVLYLSTKPLDITINYKAGVVIIEDETIRTIVPLERCEIID